MFAAAGLKVYGRIYIAIPPPRATCSLSQTAFFSSKKIEKGDFLS
jgi:hypothetical protein